MDVESLVLLVYIFCRMRNVGRRRIINRRRRRVLMALHRQQQARIVLAAQMQAATFMLMNMAHVAERAGDRNWMRRRRWTLPRPRFGWFEMILADNSLSHYWKEHFRMQKETFTRLVNLVAPEMDRRTTGMLEAISTLKQGAIALWPLGGGGSFRSTSAHFNVGKSTCVKITKQFCRALCRLSQRFIKFPANGRETTTAIALFQDVCRIPQAVGAINGTHIEIVAPDNPRNYFDRQHRYSVTMQAVVGENLMFLDTAIGYPGSFHDASATIYNLKSWGWRDPERACHYCEQYSNATLLARRWSIPSTSMANEALPKQRYPQPLTAAFQQITLLC